MLAKKSQSGLLATGNNLLNKNGFEWMNALDPQVQEFLSLVLEVVNNYDVDGIHGMIVCLHSCEGGYDLLTVERYRHSIEIRRRTQESKVAPVAC